MYTHLSNEIKCKNILKLMLTQDTIQLCNEIVSGLTEDDVGLVVQITDSNYAAIHIALGLAGVPSGLEQGVTPEISFLNFRTWLIAKAHDIQLGVGPGEQVGGPLSTCWHHLSDEQATYMTYKQWSILNWSFAIRKAGPAIAGPLCLVLKMIGTDTGCADMFELPQMFGWLEVVDELE